MSIDLLECRDCGDANIGPMLHDVVWSTIAEPCDLLCLACMESRLGRKLGSEDFTDCPWNDVYFSRYARWVIDNVERAAEHRPPELTLLILQHEHEFTEYRMRMIRDHWRKAGDATRVEMIYEWRECAAMQRRLNTATEILR